MCVSSGSIGKQGHLAKISTNGISPRSKPLRTLNSHNFATASFKLADCVQIRCVLWEPLDFTFAKVKCVCLHVCACPPLCCISGEVGPIELKFIGRLGICNLSVFHKPNKWCSAHAHAVRHTPPFYLPSPCILSVSSFIVNKGVL